MKLLSIDYKKEKMEKALYRWFDAAEVLQQDVLDLIDHNNVSRSKIARDIDTLETKLQTLKTHLKRY